MLTHNDDQGEPHKAQDETAATKIETLIERRCKAIFTNGRATAHSLRSTTRSSYGAGARRTRGEPDGGRIDSLSANTTESGGLRGFDAGKKIEGRKRHIVTDTLGHLVGLVVHM